MDYAAGLRNAPISAQKCRLVADLIRGASVQDANDMLAFPTRKAEAIMGKLLTSAVSNAQNNFRADVDELRVASVCVDGAMKISRFRAAARGRGARYQKHRCHIRIVLSDGRPSQPAAPEPAGQDEDE